MLRNYIKIAWRNFKRDTAYSLINTIGIAIAISAFMVISLFIYDELSYDRYHEGADQIFRVYKVSDLNDVNYRTLATSNLLAPTLQQDISGIQETVRISNKFSGNLVESETQRQYEDGLFMADPTLFDIFSFPFVRGNPETALNRALTVVLTESASDRYFGDATNPMGKTLRIKTRFGEDEYEVTGIIEDIPNNTHFSFEILTSLETLRAMSPNPEDNFGSWYYVGSYTYVKLKKGIEAAEIENQFPGFLSRHQGERSKNRRMGLQPVTDIHLYSNFRRELKPNSDIRYVYIFGTVALLILIIASINYANLSVAKSADRAMDVGIHKTLGMSRYQGVIRFLAESLILCAISVIIGICLAEALLPVFNNLTGKELSLFELPLPFIIILLLFTTVFGLANGLYPALALTRYRPVRILKGGISGRKKSTLRNGLIVFQFSVTVILIACTLIINNQLDYVNNKRLGLNDEQVINVEAGTGLESNFSLFRDQLMQYPAIQSITFTGGDIPAANINELCLYPTGGKGGNNNMLAIGPNF